MQAKKANTSEADIVSMMDSLWLGTKFLNTRSKEGQKPRLMLRVIYKENSQFFIGLLDELITLKNEDSSMIRNIGDAEIDFTKLVDSLNKATNKIEKVVIVLDSSMNKYKSELSEINNIEFVDEMKIME
jgi:CRISPR-associated protein Csh2